MEKETPKTPQPNAPHSDDSLSNEIINGKYRLKKAIARGGMGVIYSAEQLNLGREVAIKLILQQTDEDAEQRFLQEASLAARIDHPNVIRVYDFGKDQQNRMFLVMELLQGHTLQEYIQEKGALSVTETTDLGIQLSEALIAIHSAGMVHRDIKPANIFLIQTPGKRICSRLIDFGLVKDLNNENKVKTQTGFILGSPMYMATEQIRSEPVDGRSDIYSLGLSLYFGITGKPPYSCDNIASMLHNQLVNLPQPLEVVFPDKGFPQLLQWIFDTSYSKSPKNRFANAHQMLFAFQTLAQGFSTGSFANLQLNDKGLFFDNGQEVSLKTLVPEEITYHIPAPSLNTAKSKLGVHSNGTILFNDFEDTVPQSAKKPKSKVILVVLCVVATLIAGVLFYISAQTKSTSLSNTTSPETTQNPAAKNYQLTTIPAQVEVYKDGSQMGLTPWTYVLQTDQELTVSLQKEGYISQQIKLTPTNPNPTIKLKPVPVTAPTVQPEPEPTQTASDVPPKTTSSKPKKKHKAKEDTAPRTQVEPPKSDLKDPWDEQ